MKQERLLSRRKEPRLATDKAVLKPESDSGASIFRSPLRYPGGKQKAIEQICQRFPRAANEYREPLVGGASVFMYARSINFAQRYWINDKFKELISFWRTVQGEESCKKLVEDLKALRGGFRSVAEIKHFFLTTRDMTAIDEFEEAFNFFFFNRVTFSGTTRAGGFSASASEKRFTDSSIERLKPMPQVFSNVKITNLDFDEVITPPGDNVFLFLDPPYFTATKLYGRDGSLHAFDHRHLALCLKTTPHRFLITYDDCPEIRSLYKWAKIEKWTLQYGMNNCNLERTSKIGTELFISNY
jgi:DNA adenine methylase